MMIKDAILLKFDDEIEFIRWGYLFAAMSLARFEILCGLQLWDTERKWKH